MEFFFEFTRSVFHLLLVGGILIGGIRFKKLTLDQKLLFYLLAFTSIVELISVYLWKIKANNNFIYHFYSVIELLLLGAIYTRNLTGLIKPIYMKGVLALFVLFAIINTLFFQNLKEFNSHVTFVESLLLIALALAYFYKLIRDMEHRKLEQVPMFWINMSVLTYFSGAFLLFHVANELFTFPKDEIAMLWGTHSLFNIVHYLLYAIALWIQAENLKQEGS